MTSAQQRGRFVLAIYFAILLAISLIIIILYVSTRGIEYLPVRIARFALTCALFLWLYRGSNAARAICIALFGLSGIQSTLALLEGGGFLVHAFFGCMALTYLSFAVVLISSRSVSGFLEYRRGHFVPAVKIVPVGDVFLWPKYLMLKPLDPVTLALPAGILSPHEALPDVIKCDKGAGMSVSEADDRIYISLNVGTEIWLCKSAQAMIPPALNGEKEAKRFMIRSMSASAVSAEHHNKG